MEEDKIFLKVLEENRSLRSKLYATEQELYLQKQLNEEYKIKIKELKKEIGKHE